MGVPPLPLRTDVKPAKGKLSGMKWRFLKDDDGEAVRDEPLQLSEAHTRKIETLEADFDEEAAERVQYAYQQVIEKMVKDNEVSRRKGQVTRDNSTYVSSDEEGAKPPKSARRVQISAVQSSTAPPPASSGPVRRSSIVTATESGGRTLQGSGNVSPKKGGGNKRKGHVELPPTFRKKEDVRLAEAGDDEGKKGENEEVDPDDRPLSPCIVWRSSVRVKLATNLPEELKPRDEYTVMGGESLGSFPSYDEGSFVADLDSATEFGPVPSARFSKKKKTTTYGAWYLPTKKWDEVHREKAGLEPSQGTRRQRKAAAAASKCK
mmetsp:Transcript_33645/g.86198  ORF Transcript_33645/g.86198 Transcript_33645/m.86198 type:complete len:320 (-) Transcript_33645:829-1788(-)